MSKYQPKSKVMKCPSCGKTHRLTATYDSKGKIRAYFCPDVKDIAVLTSTEWNGLNIEYILKRYIPFIVDTSHLDRLHEASLNKLAFKVAICFKEYTRFGENTLINIYFAKKIAYRLLVAYRDKGKATANTDKETDTKERAAVN